MHAGEGFAWVTEKKVRMMYTYFSMVDTDGGGQIDKDEFSQIMHDPLFMGADVSQVRVCPTLAAQRTSEGSQCMHAGIRLRPAPRGFICEALLKKNCVRQF
jgi:hypothetical protein